MGMWLTYGRQVAAVPCTTMQAQEGMIEMASGAIRWIGDLMPRRGIGGSRPHP